MPQITYKKRNANKKTCNIMGGGKLLLLKPWIDESKLTTHISMNPHPNAIKYLEQHPEKINTDWLFRNQTAIDAMFGNPNNINLLAVHHYLFQYGHIANLYRNSNSFHILNKYPDKIVWEWLHLNPDIDKFYQRNMSLFEQNKNKINWDSLSRNPNAIHLLEAYHGKINWEVLSVNPNIDKFVQRNVKLFEQNKDKINWDYLSGNPDAINLLEANKNKINWDALSRNPNAIHLLEANKDKIDWESLSGNPSIDKFMQRNVIFFEDNKDKLDWAEVSANHYAIHVLKEYAETYLDDLDWPAEFLVNPNAISILEKYPERVDWDILSDNPNIDKFIQRNPRLFEKNKDKLQYTALSRNPAIFHNRDVESISNFTKMYSLKSDKSNKTIKNKTVNNAMNVLANAHLRGRITRYL